MGTQNTQVFSSDAVHNRNCYEYFLQLKPIINSELILLLPQMEELKNLDEYDETTPYGDLYSSIIASLEKIIDEENELSPEQEQVVDRLIERIYHNDNHILSGEYTGWINEIASNITPQETNTSAKIVKKLKDPRKTINHISPNDTGSAISRFYSLFSKNYKPQLETNIPSIKNYFYKSPEDPVEYRFSTQAQRHKGQVRVSPLFKRWLQIQAAKNSSAKVSHIYFNNLGYDRNELDLAGSNERDFSLALHELEKDPKLKIVVITLPAHQGLMASGDYKKTENSEPYSLVFNELLAISMGEKPKSGVADFVISPYARKLLFDNDVNERVVLEALLTQSFKALGFNSDSYLSTAQQQAVWVHFTKYELTNYIIQTLKPLSYNFSCKDAIDRGAVSSAYFNLVKSFTTQKPMSREEFERALDAAAAMVKGRGMNFHRKIIWNAIDAYVNANYEHLIKSPQTAWLIYWRDMNCPHCRAKQLLQTRIEESLAQFNSLTDSLEEIKEQGTNLITKLRELHTHNVSGKRILLEVVSRTSELVNNFSTEALNRYRSLANDLKVNYPKLMILSGMMEMLLGAILYLPSFGYSQKFIERGYAKYKTGFFAEQRNEVSDEMINFTKHSEIFTI